MLLLLLECTKAQDGRITDPNTIGWQQLFVFVPIKGKWGLHAEYQWRRTDGLKNWQQGLFRTAVQYKFNSQVSAQLGYAEVETFTYGDYPIAPNGTFPEHRIYEQLLLQQTLGKTAIAHRFRAEQRWLARLVPGKDREIDSWVFLHRFRYQARVKQPLVTGKKHTLYAVLADELFIGAGKNIGINFFDQNRFMTLIGVTFTKNLFVEAGYLNQTLQQGRAVNNRAVFQKNNGWILALNLNL